MEFCNLENIQIGGSYHSDKEEGQERKLLLSIMNYYFNKNTIEVKVGDVKIGGNNPIVIQSMCNTSPDDVEKGYQQARELANAGSQLIRFTVRNSADVEVLAQIKKRLRDQGISTPLVADVHFNPQAALKAAEVVEKVRINPGNFLGKRANVENPKEYSPQEWNDELQLIEEKLINLLSVCRKCNTAIRIGVNHGSLSERIMSKYGNTPEGMVESAMEFLRICRKNNFNSVVVSLKSSNVRVMTTAYRMLVEAMHAEGLNYPLHLGVTEAGNELAGRVRSAVGIGTLLFDGIGNTIRVSLTENPVSEIAPAQKLADYCSNPSRSGDPKQLSTFDYKNFTIHQAFEVDIFGGKNPPAVILDLRHFKEINEEILHQIGYHRQNHQWIKSSTAPDAIFIETNTINAEWPKSLRILFDPQIIQSPNEDAIPVFTKTLYLDIASRIKDLVKMVACSSTDLDNPTFLDLLKNDPRAIILLDTYRIDGFHDQRQAILILKKCQIRNPVILRRNYATDDSESYILQASADLGGLMLNGFGHGIWLTNPFCSELSLNRELMFEILQASRTRISQTEYIACPSCGRTQFEIEKVLAEIKKRTSHLKHLKIGVMGCIVNGPGEMSDADYGYVGAAPGKVMLYKGKTLVKKNIPTHQAVDQLIELIRENGDWIEP
ncbi:MAG TPA: (E)-4-hydroxy-3-methylbut-2-enyl-diphosphate synthase [Salinivirgaceae bacterium]|nr:(E)-4-hydroxy-3-methylbut-2-enyl-diphosphate synthase [Salinivirgaceae bacterium]